MRFLLTAVLLGVGTLGAVVPADASWLSDSVRNGSASVYVGPAQPTYGYAQPYGYVAPSYYPQAYVPAPYVAPYPAMVPSASFYLTRPGYPLYHGYHSYSHHNHYHR